MAYGKKTGGNDFKKGKPGGPGRPKLTNKQKIEQKSLRDYYNMYLKDGEAIKDFKRAKRKIPLACIQEAEDRVHGKATNKFEGNIEANIKITREIIK